MRIIATGFAVSLGLAALLNYIPGLADAEGRTFGIFALDAQDDLLHAASALWAAVSAYGSRRASVFFLRAFGLIYGLDGLLGLATGSGYLDLGILKHGIQDLPLSFRIFANAPHILLGAIGVLCGFVLGRREEVRA
jgi:hypothetical protein